MTLNKQAFLEAIKEPLRLLVLAIIPLAIVLFSQQNYEYAVAAVVVLRWIDKYLHEYAKLQTAKKRKDGIGGVKGLTGF